MKLYNSLTKKIEDFTPSSDNISLYSCGPTVYKNGHIGNLVSAIYADTLRRALSFAYPDKEITHVMNFTDIDDKTVKQSRLLYPDLDPMTRLQKLTRQIEQEVLDDYRAVGIATDNIKFVRATEHMEEMKNLIKNLLDSKVAYIGDDGIYFSIAKYKEMRKVYGQLVTVTEESTGAQRIDNDEYDKDQIHDFALWKIVSDDEPSWDFEIDSKKMKGRPGWHIECSAMSTTYLGQPFDIHSGGVDLKFPHHENEIAQSTATADDLMARFFFHSEHLLVDGKKMAKSENNFYVLKDITDRGYDPLAFRLFVLQGHYQNQLNFSWEALDAAASRLNSLKNLTELKYQVKQQDSVNASEIFKPIEDNIHTPKLLANLDIQENQIEAYLKYIDLVLGLNLSAIKDAPKEIYSLIEKRQSTRENGDFAKSDAIRDELLQLGYELKDTPQKTFWQRKY